MNLTRREERRSLRAAVDWEAHERHAPAAIDGSTTPCSVNGMHCTPRSPPPSPDGFVFNGPVCVCVLSCDEALLRRIWMIYIDCPGTGTGLAELAGLADADMMEMNTTLIRLRLPLCLLCCSRCSRFGCTARRARRRLLIGRHRDRAVGPFSPSVGRSMVSCRCISIHHYHFISRRFLICVLYF